LLALKRDRLNRKLHLALFGLLFFDIRKASAIEVYWLEPKRIVFRECIIKIFSAKLSDGTNCSDHGNCTTFGFNRYIHQLGLEGLSKGEFAGDGYE
jgi:hypothetical protein